MKAKPEDDLRKDIEIRAYLIWEREGRPHGRQEEHWRLAEAEIRTERAPKSRAKAKPSTPKTKKTAKGKAGGGHAVPGKAVSGGRRKGPKSAGGMPGASG